jgi:hypothetical protein
MDRRDGSPRWIAAMERRDASDLSTPPLYAAAYRGLRSFQSIRYAKQASRTPWNAAHVAGGGRGGGRRGTRKVFALMMIDGFYSQNGRVCVLLLQDLLQSCSSGGRRRVEDRCYERRRAEACVDESAHHALENAGGREIV